MAERNRSEGWSYAKLTGHKNEDLVKLKLDTDAEFANNFLQRTGFSDCAVMDTSVGGIHETNVDSVNSRKTKSKTDLKVFLDNGETINVSIKKSETGQVYLVGAELFISTFEKQFDTEIPCTAQRAIRLFWAAADDAVDIIKKYADRSNKKNFNRQIHHKSLNAETLRNYDEALYNDLLDWFIDNAYEITMLSFSMGAVKNKDEWSDFIWYINLLEETNIDDIFDIKDICSAAKASASEGIYFSSKNGGTTIKLPFGLVQWHQAKLQFRHDYDDIKGLLF